jgi:hypothetical protein
MPAKTTEKSSEGLFEENSQNQVILEKENEDMV